MLPRTVSPADVCMAKILMWHASIFLPVLMFKMLLGTNKTAEVTRCYLGEASTPGDAETSLIQLNNCRSLEKVPDCTLQMFQGENFGSDMA